MDARLPANAYGHFMDAFIRLSRRCATIALVVSLAASTTGAVAQTARGSQGRTNVFPAAEWQRVAAPESLGYSSTGLAEARAKLGTMQTTGLMAVVGGRVILEYGDVDTVSYLASARKSVLSMLFGIYKGRGVIDLEQTLEQLRIDDLGGLTRAERQAKVRDLLSARSGVYHAASNPGDDLARAPARGSQKPRAYYLYSNWDFNALGTIFEQTTRRSIYDALQRDIAEPIGMQDFRRELHRRDGDTTLSVHLAYHMHLSVRDMARIGYLMLRDGNWNGRQIVPVAWVRESTRPVTPRREMNPPERQSAPFGYGYLWWVWDAADTPADYRGAYAAMGAFGQYIVVMPALDLVVAHKTIPGNNRDVSLGEFLAALDLIVRAKTGVTERVAIRLADSVLRRYVGEYEFTPRAALAITLENGVLFAQLTGQRQTAIDPESDTSFFYREANARIAFTRDAAGTVTGLVLHQSGGRATPARRRP